MTLCLHLLDGRPAKIIDAAHSIHREVAEPEQPSTPHKYPPHHPFEVLGLQSQRMAEGLHGLWSLWTRLAQAECSARARMFSPSRNSVNSLEGPTPLGFWEHAERLDLHHRPKGPLRNQAEQHSARSISPRPWLWPATIHRRRTHPNPNQADSLSRPSARPEKRLRMGLKSPLQRGAVDTGRRRYRTVLNYSEQPSAT